MYQSQCQKKKCWVPINIHMLIYGHIGILHDRNKRNIYAYIQLWHMISMQMQQANDIVPYEYVIFIHNKKSGKKMSTSLNVWYPQGVTNLKKIYIYKN